MKDFVPYELALELKQLGFDEPCFGYYVGLGDNKENPFKLVQIESEKGQFEWIDNVCHAPTFSQAFRWFRETYNLHSCVAPVYEDETKKVILYWFWIQGFDDFDSENIDYKTPEEAELACLIKLIELVKEKQHESNTNR
jgi:hypothetical protein